MHAQDGLYGMLLRLANRHDMLASCALNALLIEAR
jgi:hypothetical protein